MFNRITLLTLLMLAAQLGQAQVQLSIDSSFVNFPEREPAYNYGFTLPIQADVIQADPSTYQPAMNNRYYMSIYGPRYKSVSGSNIGKYDFHIGQDITVDVQANNVQYGDNNLPAVSCMCAGVVERIVDGPDSVLEHTGTGRYVRVMCQDTFAVAGWGNIYMAYRHLSQVVPGLEVGDTLSQSDTVGIAGESGHTSTNHLHYSLQRRIGNTNSFENPHTMRVFNPGSHPHLHKHLDRRTEIHQLKIWEDSALFRIAIPHNTMTVHHVRVSYGTQWSRLYDFETIAMLDEDDRDDNDAVAGLRFFAYSFNHGLSAYSRYESTKNSMPSAYPASPARGIGDFFPIENQGLYQMPSYVLDLMVDDLPQNFNHDSLRIELVDIYGIRISAHAVNYNEAPKINSITPVLGNHIQAQQVQLSAQASDADGTVELVKFYIDEQLIGIDSIAPFAMLSPVLGFGLHEFKVKAFDNQGKSDSLNSEFSTYSSLSEISISRGKDDVEEHEDGDIAKTNGDLELAFDGSRGHQTIGLRFNAIPLHTLDQLTHAYIQFTAEEEDEGLCSLKVFIHETDSAGEFSYTDFNVSNRTRIMDSITWTPAAWLVSDARTWHHRTPDLKPLIDAITQRQGWKQGNSISFAITGTGTRTAYSYDGASLNAQKPTLHLEYVAANVNQKPLLSQILPEEQSFHSGLVNLSATASDADGEIEAVYFYIDGQLAHTDESAPYTHVYHPNNQGWKELIVKAEDDQGAITVSDTIRFSTYQYLQEIKIATGNDDVEEYGYGKIAKSNSDLELCYDGSDRGHQTVGLRFQNIQVPNGATITRAYIQFTAEETDDDVADLKLFVQAVDSSAAFSYSYYNVSQLSRVNDSIVWSPVAWNIEDERGIAQRTPDIKRLIQATTDRQAWDGDNALSLLINGTGTRTAYSYNGDGTHTLQPMLHIEFSYQGSNMNATHISTIERPNLEVFPNPSVNRVVKVRTQHEGAGKIQLLSMNGKLVHTQLTTHGEATSTMDLHHLKPGVYVVIYIPDNGPSQNRKLILR